MKTDSLFDLTGKVAIVTGGGDGIGKGCCEILAAAGASVVVSDLTLEKARATADEITTAGGKAAATACNVLEQDELSSLVDFTVKTYGTVNILVNNAGMGGGGRENPFKIDRAYVEQIYAINVFAPWQLCKLVAPPYAEVGLRQHSQHHFDEQHKQRSRYGYLRLIEGCAQSHGLKPRIRLRPDGYPYKQCRAGGH